MTVTEVSPSDVAARVLRARALTLALRVEGTRTVVVLRGEADLFDLPLLSDALSRVIAMRTGDVVIDFAELEFVDVPTVRVLAVS